MKKISSQHFHHVKVFATHLEYIMRYIQEFPYDLYDIHSVEYNDLTVFFYLDALNDHIKNYLKQGISWENLISKLIVKYTLPGSTVIDVGAHIGTHTLIMAHSVHNNGRVLAFEPQPKLFRELCHNTKLNLLNNVSCIWAAIGRENGKIELAPTTVNNEGGTSLIKGGSGMYVDLLTIDSLGLNDVSLIKIDVEGMENMVLEGAAHTILKNKPIIILEILGGFLPETASNDIIMQIEYTKHMIINFGYDIHRIADWDYLAVPKR